MASDFVETLVGILVVSTIFAIAGVIGVLIAFRQADRWRRLGDALGLAPEGPPPTWLIKRIDFRALRGERAGRVIRLHTYTTGSGKRSNRWTDLEVEVPNARPGFLLTVTPEGVSAKLAKLAGGEDVQVGDADFDRAFRVRANDPSRAQRALGLSAAQAILSLRPFKELTVEGGRVRCVYKGLQTDVETVRSRIDTLIGAADTLTRG